MVVVPHLFQQASFVGHAADMTVGRAKEEKMIALGHNARTALVWGGLSLIRRRARRSP
jgi:hypothetical protein